MGIQPRIRLMRSYDETAHSYQGYTLRIEGMCGDMHGEFLIAVGEAAHKKHQFRVGMKVSGVSVPVENPKLEIAEFYKTSQIKAPTGGCVCGQHPGSFRTGTGQGGLSDGWTRPPDQVGQEGNYFETYDPSSYGDGRP